MLVEMTKYGSSDMQRQGPHDTEVETRKSKRKRIAFAVVVLTCLAVGGSMGMGDVTTISARKESQSAVRLANRVVAREDGPPTGQPPPRSHVVQIDVYEKLLQTTRTCMGFRVNARWVLTAQNCLNFKKWGDLSLLRVHVYDDGRTENTTSKMVYFPVDITEEWLYIYNSTLIADAALLEIEPTSLSATEPFLPESREDLGCEHRRDMTHLLPVQIGDQVKVFGKVTYNALVVPCGTPFDDHTHCIKELSGGVFSQLLGGEAVIKPDRYADPRIVGVVTKISLDKKSAEFEWVGSQATDLCNWMMNTMFIPDSICEKHLRVLGDDNTAHIKDDQKWVRVRKVDPYQGIDSARDVAIAFSGQMWIVRSLESKLAASHGYFLPSTVFKTCLDDKTYCVERVALQSVGCRVAAVCKKGCLITGDRHPKNEKLETVKFKAVRTRFKIKDIAFGKTTTFAIAGENTLLGMTRFPRGIFVVIETLIEHVSAHGDYMAVVTVEGKVKEMNLATSPGKWVEVDTSDFPGRVRGVSIGRDGTLVLKVYQPYPASGLDTILVHRDREKNKWLNLFTPAKVKRFDVESQNRVIFSASDGVYKGAISHTRNTTRLNWIASDGLNCVATCENAKMMAVSGNPLDSDVKTNPLICSADHPKGKKEHGRFAGWSWFKDKKGGERATCTVPGVALENLWKANKFECLCRSPHQDVEWVKMTEECKDCRYACNRDGMHAIQTDRASVDLGVNFVCAAYSWMGEFRPGFGLGLMPGCYVTPLRKIDFLCPCVGEYKTRPPTSPPTKPPSKPPTPSPSSAPSMVPSAPPTNVPSAPPTEPPSLNPTTSPPTGVPTKPPSTSPPTKVPSASPTLVPSASPSAPPTPSPTALPSNSPTNAPSSAPSAPPTTPPTRSPTTCIKGLELCNIRLNSCLAEQPPSPKSLFLNRK